MQNELQISQRPSTGSGTRRMELQISQRGVDMPESPIRKLAPLAYAAEDEGVKIYRLNIGQPARLESRRENLPTPHPSAMLGARKALDALKNVI